ncbi:hypothetical protein KDK95_20760 [Actinospica sp. MGRD01-02]|uniref:NB-ARC domain-containing protein n=1 Tax=Actinospica acidithermotolerans TaxID=2828514 RepID=A0A941ECG2_9ACTN|nr:hypothetical protein [Actinospica acidithermotolerans]MBR7828752.1 hypothetical protein [Actinospica acidithermotolerans]
MMDGGRTAARGFQYQYHRTLEWLVAHLDDPAVAAVRVEGPAPTETAVGDSVDFDAQRDDGSVIFAAQVKSKALGLQMSAPKAFDALLALAKGSTAERYALVTNAALDATAQRLAAALEEASDLADLRARLASLFPKTKAPRRAEQVARLDDELLARLSRSRIQVDPRDDDEIRTDLREALRTYRNRHREGLGDQSAGLLSGYLISEVLWRAADTAGERAAFDVASLRGHVLVPGDVLASALGWKDWGSIVGLLPRVPDVSRRALLNELCAAVDTPRDTPVRRVALLGLSGIGKSSLAVQFVAERADAYDLIGWIDSETPQSMLASFHALLAAMDPAVTGRHEFPPDQLAHRVRAALGRLSGRWLLVFDNAGSVRDMEPWVPALGRGDVILTSLDAASNYGDAKRVNVGTMLRDEAVALLTRRLQLAVADQRTHAEVLDRLAAGLGDWPLALELGAGYIYSCGIALTGVDEYLTRLTARALSDHDSVPPGYPRTLVAALGLSLDKITARSTQSLDRAQVALGMLIAAGYLASQRIPAHLLLAVAAGGDVGLDAEAEADQTPAFMAPEEADLGEHLRELRRFSLIGEDLPLPHPFPAIGPESARTITVNTVVQVVVRARVGSNPDLPTGLKSLAWHVNNWLHRSLALGDAEGTAVLQTHGERLLDHIEAIGLTSQRIALLYGNLAGGYSKRCQDETAAHCYLRALHHVDASPPTNLALRVQNQLGLATVYWNRVLREEIDGGEDAAVADVASLLQEVLRQAEAWSHEPSGAAMKIALLAANLLSRSPVEGLPPALERLSKAFARLISRLPASEYSGLRAQLDEAEVQLQQRNFRAAESICRHLVARGVADIDTGAKRLLIEALIGQERWPSALGEIHDWAQSPTGPRLAVQDSLDLIHNAGVVCALGVMQRKDGPTKVLEALLDWPSFDVVLNAATPGERGRIELLCVINDYVHGRDLDQDRLWKLARVDLASPYGGTQSWQLLRRMVISVPRVYTDAD